MLSNKINTVPLNKYSSNFFFYRKQIQYNYKLDENILEILIQRNILPTDPNKEKKTWVECLPMVRETGVQSPVTSYQKLLKSYLIPPCITLSNIRNVSRVKWNNSGKGVAPSLTHRCSSYSKGSPLVALDYGHQLYFTYIYNNFNVL